MTVRLLLTFESKHSNACSIIYYQCLRLPVTKTLTIERQTLLLLKSTTYSQNNNYVTVACTLCMDVFIELECTVMKMHTVKYNGYHEPFRCKYIIYQMSDDQIAK